MSLVLSNALPLWLKTKDERVYKEEADFEADCMTWLAIFSFEAISSEESITNRYIAVT
jgi:hypothetical protein